MPKSRCTLRVNSTYARDSSGVVTTISLSPSSLGSASSSPVINWLLTSPGNSNRPLFSSPSTVSASPACRQTTSSGANRFW